MAEAVIRFPAGLRSFVGGRASIAVDAPTVRAALTQIARETDGLMDRLFLPSGELRRHINVYLGEENLRNPDRLDAPLSEGATVLVIQAFAGG